MSDKPIIAVYDDWGSVSKALTLAGATVLQVDSNRQSKRALEVADAVVLTGGGDVDPKRYGALNRHARVYGVNAQRDAREFKAVKHAMAHKLPMFGICRGLQLLNVAHGGSLTQHIYDNDAVDPHEGVMHDVKVRMRSRVGEALGTGHLLGTSIHHQAIARMGHGLLPAGWAHDGTVEMIESVGTEPYVLATQFHPEMDYTTDDTALDIFRHFVRMVPTKPNGAKRSKSVNYMVYKPYTYTPMKKYEGSAGSTYYAGGSTSYGSSYAYVNPNEDGDWKWDFSKRMWVPADEDEHRPLSRADIDRFWDDDYAEWDALNTLGLLGQDTADEVCAFPPCKNPGGCLNYGDCEAEAVAAQRANPSHGSEDRKLGKTLGDYVESIEASKRGHRR